MADSPSPSASRLPTGLIVTFGFLYAGLLLASIVPNTWWPHAALKPVTEPFQELTGTPQKWDMFHTIPKFFSMTATLDLHFSDGRIEQKGPVLPGLNTARTPEDIRYFYAINRMLYLDDFKPYREAWESKLAEKITAEGASAFEVEVENRMTRHLFHIAKDGELSAPTTVRFGTAIEAP